jgi:hypothetical protein
MRGLIFSQSVNRPGRKDATGAFLLGADQFRRLHNLGEVVKLDGHHDREAFIDTIASATELDVIAYFGHGTRASLPSAGIAWTDIQIIAPLIKRALVKNTGQVMLYACSTAGHGYFADHLSKLMGYAYTVWGHTCVGHSFTNPYVQYFPNLSSPYLIDPNGPLWSKWYSLIKDPASNVWARFPFMSQADLEEEVATTKAKPLKHGGHKRH